MADATSGTDFAYLLFFCKGFRLACSTAGLIGGNLSCCSWRMGGERKEGGMRDIEISFNELKYHRANESHNP